MSGVRGIVLGSQLEVGILRAVTSYLLPLANLHAKKSVISAYAEGRSCARLDAILLYHDMTRVDTIHLVDKLFLRVASQLIVDSHHAALVGGCVVSARIELLKRLEDTWTLFCM